MNFNFNIHRNAIETSRGVQLTHFYQCMKFSDDCVLVDIINTISTTQNRYTTPPILSWWWLKIIFGPPVSWPNPWISDPAAADEFRNRVTYTGLLPTEAKHNLKQNDRGCRASQKKKEEKIEGKDIFANIVCMPQWRLCSKRTQAHWTRGDSFTVHNISRVPTMHSRMQLG